MKTQHTKGPWRYSNGCILADDRSVIGTYFTDSEEEIANGILMAKAPMLLEALDALSLVVGLTAIKHESDLPALQEAMDQARKAIAAATP